MSEHFHSVPMFLMCTKKELQALSKHTTQSDVPAGRVLTVEGTPGREFVIVLDGSAVVTRNGRKVAELGPGDYFGEIALLDPGERTATVTAQTKMTLAILTPNEFGDILEAVPALAHKVMRGMARRIRDLSGASTV